MDKVGEILYCRVHYRKIKEVHKQNNACNRELNNSNFERRVFLFLQLLMLENLDLKLTPYNVLATSTNSGKYIDLITFYCFLFLSCNTRLI